MNPKEKLLWLAENADTSSEVEVMWEGNWGQALVFSLECLLENDIRLSPSEILRRNPGFEVIRWIGRLPFQTKEYEKFVDGWLLRWRKERYQLKGMSESSVTGAKVETERHCTNCGNIPKGGYCYRKCNSYDQWTPKPEAPAAKNVTVKSWVRWPRSTQSKIQYAVQKRIDNEVYFNDAWHYKDEIIKQGCEHTDTPNIEESWQKIGG